MFNASGGENSGLKTFRVMLRQNILASWRFNFVHLLVETFQCTDQLADGLTGIYIYFEFVIYQIILIYFSFTCGNTPSLDSGLLYIFLTLHWLISTGLAGWLTEWLMIWLTYLRAQANLNLLLTPHYPTFHSSCGNMYTPSLYSGLLSILAQTLVVNYY